MLQNQNASLSLGLAGNSHPERCTLDMWVSSTGKPLGKCIFVISLIILSNPYAALEYLPPAFW